MMSTSNAFPCACEPSTALEEVLSSLMGVMGGPLVWTTRFRFGCICVVFPMDTGSSISDVLILSGFIGLERDADDRHCVEGVGMTHPIARDELSFAQQLFCGSVYFPVTSFCPMLGNRFVYWLSWRSKALSLNNKFRFLLVRWLRIIYEKRTYTLDCYSHSFLPTEFQSESTQRVIIVLASHSRVWFRTTLNGATLE